jgi:hypothetical protein
MPYYLSMNNETIDFLALLLAPASTEEEARWEADRAARSARIVETSAQPLSAEGARAMEINAAVNAANGKAAPALVADPACRCGRCNGTGHIAQFYYNANGICFGCDGTGRA